jgi:hypothetical protein
MTRTGGGVLSHELQERFAAGAVQRGVLLQHGDDPAVGRGQLMVRVFIPAPGLPEDGPEPPDLPAD